MDKPIDERLAHGQNICLFDVFFLSVPHVAEENTIVTNKHTHTHTHTRTQTSARTRKNNNHQRRSRNEFKIECEGNATPPPPTPQNVRVIITLTPFVLRAQLHYNVKCVLSIRLQQRLHIAPGEYTSKRFEEYIHYTTTMNKCINNNESNTNSTTIFRSTTLQQLSFYVRRQNALGLDSGYCMVLRQRQKPLQHLFHTTE